MFGTKDIAEILKIEAVTVRKYARALEVAGYNVNHDGNGRRQYSDTDVTALRELQALRERTGLTVEKCAEVVASRHREASESVTLAKSEEENQLIEQYEERYKEMMKLVESMSEQNERLLKRFEDQNNNISVILREVLETKRLVAAANEKKWWEFWKKDVLPTDDPEYIWQQKKTKF